MTTILKRLATWLAVAAVTMGVAAAVVVFAAVGRDNGDVLSQEDVSRALSDDPTAEATNAPPTDPSTGPTGAPIGATQAMTSQAGLLTVRCDGNTAQLVRWVPKNGYRVDEVVRGPAAQVSVWFESDSFDDVEAVVVCSGGKAALTDHLEFDDHGRGGDDDRGGGGNSGRG